MKTITFIFLLLVITFAGCSHQSKNKTDNKITTSDTVKTNNIDTIQKPQHITNRFLKLIQHIDSAGYTFDTLRYKLDSIVIVNNYIFFDKPVTSTIPFFVVDMHENGEIVYDDLVKNFDIKPFEKATRVITYYFKQKQPDIIDGQKWYTDGLIEEWIFNNENDALKAGNELINSVLSYIYFNTGAYVCTAGNNMYVFYSRAAGFMRTQKRFFDWFIKQNEITVYNKNNFS